MGTLCLSQHGNRKPTLPTAPIPLHHTSSAEGCAEPVGGVMLGSVHVLLVFCYCSQLVVLVCTGCSQNALQLVTVHYEIEVYSGICASICSLVVMYVELLASRLALLHLFVCMYEGAVITSQYQTMVQALRVVISTRLTIVRSMSCICVYKGNAKQPKLHS